MTTLNPPKLTAIELGKIERVDDLRVAWPREAQDFTPWLAENIEELGEALGMELVSEGMEVPVGSFALDVLATATDVSQNQTVVIENQLGTTDHDHLGKLLTYAAGKTADVIVWLAKEFRGEHRQALDWLNQRTGEDCQFFGVAVELWKIGDSPLAPYFNLVSAPNEWSKLLKTAHPLTEEDEMNSEFRRLLIERFKQEDPLLMARKRTTGTGGIVKARWLYIKYPVPEVKHHLSYVAVWPNGDLGFQFVSDIRGRDGLGWTRRVFEDLEKRKGEIEEKVRGAGPSERFEWEPDWKKQGFRVGIYRNDNVFQYPDSWDEYHDWIVEKLRLFQEHIEPLLMKEFSEHEQRTRE